jgi:hypothetical protein
MDWQTWTAIYGAGLATVTGAAQVVGWYRKRRSRITVTLEDWVHAKVVAGAPGNVSEWSIRVVNRSDYKVRVNAVGVSASGRIRWRRMRLQEIFIPLELRSAVSGGETGEIEPHHDCRISIQERDLRRVFGIKGLATHVNVFAILASGERFDSLRVSITGWKARNEELTGRTPRIHLKD